MNKLYTLLTLVLCLLIGSLSAQTIFQDDFETAGFPNTPNYTIYDLDGRTVDPSLASFFPVAWNRLRFSGDPNWFIASTSRYSPVGTANDWVVSPPLNITANNFLYFDTRSGSSSSRDGYEVRISTTDSATASFTTVLLTVSAESPNWTAHAINLSAYANQRVFIAWRNITNAGYILALDNIEVKQVFSIDMGVTDITIPSTITTGNPQAVTGIIKNFGANAVSSFDLNYSLNGGTTFTQAITGVYIASNSTYSFSHSTTFTASNPGSFTDVKVWASNINSSADQNNANDTLSSAIFVNLGNTVSRNVLFEEFTTAVCQFCPDGHVVQAQIVNAFPTVIPVGVHACFNTDQMTVPEATTLCSVLGPNSAPSGMVDRVLYPGETRVGHQRSNNRWYNRCASRTQGGSPLDITLTGTYNPANRLLNLDVTSSFVDFVEPGDIRVSLMIIEDSMSGTGNGWAQYNAYYRSVGHPFYNIGVPFASNPNISYINNYQHRHVLRDILPATWGDGSTIPTGPAINTNYTRNFLHGISTSSDANQVYLIAVVARYGGANQDGYEVINAKEIKLTDLLATGIEESSLSSNLKIYPNPTDLPYTNIEFSLEMNAAVQARITDVTGKVVGTQDFGTMSLGSQLIQLNTDRLENGFYFVNLKVGEEEITRKISILK